MATDQGNPFGWTYDFKAHRYRDSHGRFISHATAMGLRDIYTESQREAVRSIWQSYRDDADEAISGGWNPVMAEQDAIDDFFARSDVYRTVADTFRTQYLYGRGGANAMTRNDWAHLYDLREKQDRYWHQFRADALDGQLSLNQVQARIQMYINASTRFYEDAHGAAFGINLPAFPGDGGTVCLTNCKCTWEIKRQKGRYVAYWRLGEAEHCPDCQARAALWSPFIPVILTTPDFMSQERAEEVIHGAGKQLDDAQYEVNEDPTEGYTRDMAERWGEYKGYGYKAFNAYLRNGRSMDGPAGFVDTEPLNAGNQSPEDVARSVDVMEQSFRYAHLPQDAQLYRGEDSRVTSFQSPDEQDYNADMARTLNNLGPGATFTDRGFISTTFNKDFLEGEDNFGGSAMEPDTFQWRIMAPKGTPFISPDQVGGFNEDEAVLPAGTQFYVVNAYDRGPDQGRIIEAVAYPPGVQVPDDVSDVFAWATQAWADWNEATWTDLPRHISPVRSSVVIEQVHDDYHALTDAGKDAAWQAFTQDYVRINDALRHGTPMPEDAAAGEADRLASFADHQWTNMDGKQAVVYRGVNLAGMDEATRTQWQDMVAGSILTDRGYATATAYPEPSITDIYAKSAADADTPADRVTVRIAMPEHSHYAPIGGAEVALPPGTRYRVMDVIRNSDGSRIVSVIPLPPGKDVPQDERDPITWAEQAWADWTPPQVLKITPPDLLDQAAALRMVEQTNIYDHAGMDVTGPWGVYHQTGVWENERLREHPGEWTDDDLIRLASFDDSRISAPVQVYRGVSFGDDVPDAFRDMVPGSVIRDDAYVSTAVRKDTADMFAKGADDPGDILFSIVVPEHAAYVASLAVPQHPEITLPPGTQMVVQQVAAGQGDSRAVTALAIPPGSTPPQGTTDLYTWAEQAWQKWHPPT